MDNEKKELRKLESLRMFTHFQEDTEESPDNFMRTYFQEDTEESPDNFVAPRCICQDWYHKKCMNIPLKVFQDDTVAEVWKCKSCNKKYL